METSQLSKRNVPKSISSNSSSVEKQESTANKDNKPPSWTWGVENKWTNWRNYIPRKHVVLTLEELKKYDGSDPNLPIYISINGELYDVSEGRTFYGPGGSYHLFAGKDSARAFGTSCLSRQDHLTHDTRGLDDGQLQAIGNIDKKNEDWG
ncbi:hypothetical protein H4219_004135 [Mycoemilia scoparia]|uniref:Cytochrome b5 heme-binding domain-containing protein n=1 Tax=Mycoemilia scoparia TaxID=417184 RepID=A0A9W7ZTH4_9FUNG|nr:hypothetical protein H4219_004135 [Mycoemilia scoparia]